MGYKEWVYILERFCDCCQWGPLSVLDLVPLFLDSLFQYWITGSPENWISISGKYYYQSVMSQRIKFTYNEAKSQCNKSGGKLAEPDENDNEELKSFQVFTSMFY